MLAYGDKSLRFVNPTATIRKTHSPATHEKTPEPTKDSGAIGRSYRSDVDGLLPRHVAPNDPLATGELVVGARRHGHHAIDVIGPAARAAMFLLGKAADRRDI